MLVRGVRRLLTRQAAVRRGSAWVWFVVYASCAWVLANEMVQAGRDITELTSSGSTLVRTRTLIRHLVLRLRTPWIERMLDFMLSQQERLTEMEKSLPPKHPPSLTSRAAQSGGTRHRPSACRQQRKS